MADGDWLAGAFEEHRDHLRAVAYRLLGEGVLIDVDLGQRHHPARIC